MLQVHSNPLKNHLYITLEGHFSSQEVRDAGEAVLREMRHLSPNFDLINDMRQCHPTDAEGLKELQAIADDLKRRGMGRCVRVTQIALAALQMERISTAVGYQPIHVYSMEEAEKILAVRLNGTAPERQPGWEALRQHRRVSVGPEYMVQFAMGEENFDSIRITNLSAQGCFAVLERSWGSLLYEGAILYDFSLKHEDLPPTRVSAKIVRLVKNLTEISEDDVGLGIMFLSPPPSFIQWVDAYVAAFFDTKS